MKNYRKLGFGGEATSAIVESLNVLLANYHVHYQKLRNFHWNVEGHTFFELHEFFEQEYNQVKVQIDDIAERIRVFGKKPYSTLKKYLEISDIKESEKDVSAEDMMKQTLDDFETIISFLIDAHEKAAELGDVATEDLMTEYIKRTEKVHWMLSSFSK